jgi:hypothetical protein
LFKIPMENTGETWAEKIAAEFGAVLGFKMMDVTFAIYEGRFGLLLRNFVKRGEDEFFDGGDLLKAIVTDFNPKSLKGYHLSNVMRAIAPFKVYNVDKEFIKMLIFDALIANQDRHCENWGVIQNKNGIRLAPFFDNGSSLGFNLTEERISRMLQDKNMFQAFTRRSKTLISVDDGTKKPKILIVLRKVYNQYPGLMIQELKRLNRLTETKVNCIVNEVPSSIMSSLYKEWVQKLIFYRMNWLENEWNEENQNG